MTIPGVIPWLDRSRQFQSVRSEMLTMLDELMGGNSFILGRCIEKLEADFARFVGVRHCIGLNSGESALQLALLACGVGPGDEVLTAPAAWMATSSAIRGVGARPVYVDIEPATYCMDVARLEDAVTPRTKAILPVHLYGQPCDMLAIRAVAEKQGLVVIEDACQAHGASFVDRNVGAFGECGCFSFCPGDALGACGQAGAVVTDNEALAQRIRRLRDHAQAGRHGHAESGLNPRMDGMQAATLGVKLKHLEAWTEARRRIAVRYDAVWSHLPGLRTPAERLGGRHARHIYALRCSERDRLQSWLAQHGVMTTVHYPAPIHLQPAFKDLGYQPGDFPTCEALCRTVLTVPCFPELRIDEVERVIAAVRAWTESGQTQSRAAA